MGMTGTSSSHGQGRSDSAGPEAGVSLIEIMLALSILSTVLVALGGLMFQAAQYTRLSAAVAYRGAASEQSAAWIQNLPWDSLATAVGCSTDTSGQLAYTRCVTLQDLSQQLKRMTVSITPSGNLPLEPDTVVIDRNRPRQRSTLSP